MITYIIIIALIAASALFSGLTLGLMSLDVYELERKKDLGDPDSKKVYPVRKRGNLLLTTLLLGNVAVNAVLSIYLGTVASGVVAGLIATALIFLFGEIIPQAVISRFALKFGAATAPLMKLIIFIMFPICFPIAWVLDRVLGEELRSVYSKQELMKVIEEHEDSPHSDIDEDEERVLKGALSFSETTVHQIMTPRTVVRLIDAAECMDKQRLKELYDTGFSRFPVYEDEKDNIVGIFYLRDMVLHPENACVRDVMFNDILTVNNKEKLDVVLNNIIKARKHLCMVYDEFSTFVGVISLEDILEEIVGREIVDEDDVVVDTRAEAREKSKL